MNPYHESQNQITLQIDIGPQFQARGSLQIYVPLRDDAETATKHKIQATTNGNGKEMDIWVCFNQICPFEPEEQPQMDTHGHQGFLYCTQVSPDMMHIAVLNQEVRDLWLLVSSSEFFSQNQNM